MSRRFRSRTFPAALAPLVRSLRSRAVDAGCALLCAVYVFGYTAWTDPYDRADADYVISGAIAAVLFAYAAFTIRSDFARLGLIAAGWEAAQKAACGVTFYGPSVEPLCVAQYGTSPYYVVATGSALYLWMRRWDLRKWRKQLQQGRFSPQRLKSLIFGRSGCGR